MCEVLYRQVVALDILHAKLSMVSMIQAESAESTPTCVADDEMADLRDDG